MSESSHIERARERLRRRAQARAVADEALRTQAAADAEAIIRMVGAKYRPTRIYQWGSVLRPGGFRQYSDIDLATEGITDPQTHFALLGEAQGMTRFPLDLVQMEKIAPEHAADIRQHGKVVYEQH
ncbi:MAG: nucleotidyltransferase domain-containing protein [Candidatus Latescibacterota bacterium]